MRINKLTVKNFKGFEERTFVFPHNIDQGGNGSFHLIIGQNGKGKTSVLDALAVAAGSWLLGVPGYKAPAIADEAIRMEVLDYGDTSRIEQQYPVLVEAEGMIAGEALTWVRERDSDETSAAKAENIKALAERLGRSSQGDMSLPLIAYYGTGRLWQARPFLGIRRLQGGIPHKPFNPLQPLGYYLAEDFASRLAGYRDSTDPTCNPRDLLNWLKFEQQLAVQENRESMQFTTVKSAIQNSVEGCNKVEYHLRLGLLLNIEGQPRLPFSALSDGQRNMVALIGDIAFKAAQLNPHLGKEVLQKTPGIVLIDELDLHLHPKWQRHVIEDLRRLFPEIQFIATTHSPFIIQTARDGELIKLDGELATEPGGKTLEEIARLIMDVIDTERSPRYQEKLNVARAYLALVAESKTATPQRREEIQARLMTMLAPFSDNPAYAALLERKGLIEDNA